MCVHTHACTHTHAHMAKLLAVFWTCFHSVSSWHVPCTEVKTSPLWQKGSATLNRRCPSARKVITNVCRNRMTRFWWTFLHFLKENKHHTFGFRTIESMSIEKQVWGFFFSLLLWNLAFLERYYWVSTVCPSLWSPGWKQDKESETQPQVQKLKDKPKKSVNRINNNKENK